MTGLEAIPRISELLRDLIGLAKDGKVSALTSQIQALFHTLQSGINEAQTDILKSEREKLQIEKKLLALERQSSEAIKELEALHAITVAELKAAHAQEIAALQQQITKLKEQNAAVSDWAIEKEKYEAAQVVEGLVLYMLKSEHRGKSPFQYFCPTCFEKGWASPLQRKMAQSQAYTCSRCAFLCDMSRPHIEVFRPKRRNRLEGLM